jgi:hypothetical protein
MRVIIVQDDEDYDTLLMAAHPMIAAVAKLAPLGCKVTGHLVGPNIVMRAVKNEGEPGQLFYEYDGGGDVPPPLPTNLDKLVVR